ncbi:MAG: hypothetical protein J6U00_07570 [Ruminococcus sp.]|uniref:hypothetical protein n=1 Tax=Ruminococcus sp. TaxID=41978 RepID=UPI001B17E653|nr:hypothetical protein [Ruminococcus sp.]MBO7473849.1 hypothetical protein [Ruminococcus sp.]
MKNKTISIISVILVCIFLVLFVPVPTGTYKDGGTRIYTALTYKIVRWSVLMDSALYKKTSVFLLPDNFKTYEELWEIEKTEKWDENKVIYY